ncbi:hypothetical protein V5O48_005756 [Marasmius crinis-equi]|uniref:PROP1-like PPR domain-containing protein n=1 Tax=Marasmius crinis-equi TaxID=585013 RepID=A0ABR3FLF8_9AGAR
MLPKVANTLIHSTGRAAAAVHTQSHHTIRNVLQLPGSSSAKGNPGSGYFNSNSGSSRGGRFTHGYHGASRAVTQANFTIAVDDGSFIQIEDEEEATPPVSGKKRASVHSQRHRLRSQSLSHSQHEHRLSVLKTVQKLHSHSRRAFEARSNSTATNASTQQPVEDRLLEMEAPSPPSVEEATAKEEESSVQPLSTDPSSPQSALPLQPANRAPSPSTPSSPLPSRRLSFVSRNKDREYTTQAVFSFLQSLEEPSPITPDLQDFNNALKALYQTRTAGEPLTLLLQTYNALLSKDFHPDVQTYLIMIRALVDRHGELSAAVAQWHNDAKWQAPTAHQVETTFVRIEQELQSTLPNALSLFRAMIEKDPSAEDVPPFIYKNLLRICASHGNYKGAIAVWEVVERTRVERTAHMYANLIQALGKGGEISACKDAFDDFLGQIPPEYFTVAENKKHATLVYNNLIEAYFRCGMSDMAVDMVERMLSAEISKPAISTMTTVISGFCTGEGPVDFPTKVTSTADTPAPLSSSPPAPAARGEPDIPTALSWFHRLLDQPHSPHGNHVLDPLASFPTRPDSLGWSVMMEALAREAEKETNSMTSNSYRQLRDLGDGKDALHSLNALVSRLEQAEKEDHIKLPATTRLNAAYANLDRARSLHKIYSSSTEPTERNELKDMAISHADIISTLYPSNNHSFIRGGGHQVVKAQWDVLLLFGEVDKCLQIASDYANSISRTKESLRSLEHSLTEGRAASSTTQGEIQMLSEIVDRFSTRFFGIVLPFSSQLYGLQCTLSQAFRLFRIVERARISMHDSLGLGILDAYGRTRRQDADVTSIPSITALQPEDWITLIDYATAQELGTGDAEFGGLVGLLNDVKAVTSGSEWTTEWPSSVKARLVNAIANGRPVEEIRRIVQECVPEIAGLKANVAQALEAYLETTESSLGSEQASTAPTSPLLPFDAPTLGTQDHAIPDAIYIDLKFTKSLNEFLSKRVLTNANTRPFTNELFAQLTKNVTQYQKVPSPATLSQLAAAFGRAGELDRIYYVYQVGQKMLKTMERNKKMQSESWFMIEDGMVIALCQAGQPEKAHIHRLRMLEMGGAPSADAYGGLVLHVKDTTDDTSNAMELYQEALHHGVEPNVYLYNNVISKLAKARKADKALELFHEMKASRFAPSPITYGAVIGACARVGDVASAEALFQEMSSQTSFRPRVPPFNTMMQLYTTTKPDRERSLWYYEEMQRRGVAPTEYTYKLLMDTYVLDPIDVPALQATFAALVANPRVKVQSMHYATLINAYGCVLKDLALAQNVFSSVPPSVLDALVFEALVNVLVAHRRMDLAPGYVELMNESGIHMTAYIVNGLIKGYSAVGDVERAREIFEGTMDPPVGVAGMHNHVGPHLNGNGEDVRPKVNSDPSTWESMVRAELGAGHRDRALALVERMKTRQYPEAVVNRVQGIMVDHSQVLI